MPKKPFPPYGREVAAILQNPNLLQQYSGCTPERGTVWLATGFEAWDWRNNHPLHLAVVVPYGEDPFKFRWDFLKGHEPPLILPPVANNPEMRRVLAAAILEAGASAVLACADDGTVRYTTGEETCK